ncbi:MAG: M28 family peptidase [Acidobacteriota bacterium]
MMSKSWIVRPLFLIGLLGLALPPAVRSQESPFVPEKLAPILRNEISGDRAYHYVRLLTPYHRIMGSQAYVEAANMLAGLARSFGLENVRVVKQKFEGGISWDPVSARLWLVQPEEMKIADFDDVALSLAVWSRSAHLTAELVDIGRASSPEDFDGVDVAGKVVLTTAPPGLAIRNAVWEKGALGVISSYTIHPEARFDSPDQVGYVKVPMSHPEGKRVPWAFMISARQYGQLQDALRKAKSNRQPVRVRVEIETQVREPAEQAYLWAELRGSEIHNQHIVLTAHLDEERTSANDNGSGCANILEIGRAIGALVKERKISRPKRDIVFWWPNEHWSEYQYFRENPEERNNMLININLDMVGARQSMGSRVQHIIRTPYSIPSYLNDVIESIAEYVVLSNTGFMAAEEAGTPQPFSKPILSFLGSRERFTAMVIPHSGGSDHEVFCERVIGVPGVALINYPDPYFHSTEDDLQNIDPTQLKRNAFIAAAAALFVANAGDGDVPMLASEVYSRALQRLGRDLNTAFAHIREKRAGNYTRSYLEARNLIEQAVVREARALESVLTLARPGGASALFVRDRIKQMGEQAPRLIRELDAVYFLVADEKKLPALTLAPEEKEMAARVPVNIDSLDEYFKKRDWVVAWPGLHPIMAKECYCFVDGKRSFLDIYRAVHAEALSVGKFYYGQVTLDAVKGLLSKAVEKGVLKLK